MDAIRGIVLEGSIADRLIVEATPADVRRIVAGTAVQVARSQLPQPADFDERVQRLLTVLYGDGILYDGDGNAVAALTGVAPQVNAFDVTSHDSGSNDYVLGLRSIKLEARAL